MNNAPTALNFMIGGGIMARVPLDCHADCAADCHETCAISCVEFFLPMTQDTSTLAVGTSKEHCFPYQHTLNPNVHRIIRETPELTTTGSLLSPPETLTCTVLPLEPKSQPVVPI